MTQEKLSMSSDHNGIKLIINNRKDLWKTLNYLETNMLQNGTGSEKKSKGKLHNIFSGMEMKTQHIRCVGSAGAAFREMHSTACALEDMQLPL